MGISAVEIAPRIVADEKVCFNKPVIRGTRLPVVVVLHELVKGLKGRVGVKVKSRQMRERLLKFWSVITFHQLLAKQRGRR